jgi:hypothetical protein
MGTKHAKPHTSNKRRKAEPAGRRKVAGRDWTVTTFAGPVVGPDVVTASLDEVLAAMAEVPEAFDWDVLGPNVLPVLPRVRPLPPGSPDPIQLVLPPGIAVRFGIDMGPMFIGVHEQMLNGWNMTTADLLGVALANLGRRAADVSPRDVVQQHVDGVAVRALQSGTASGSALVLLPEELERLFGPDPQLLVAPMRDLVLSLPRDADPGLAMDLYETFASQDPNCLPPMAFILAEGQVALAWMIQAGGGWTAGSFGSAVARTGLPM